MSEEANLNEDEKKQVDEHSDVPISVIFEAIRRDGQHELLRPASALWWSGVAAGLAISTSVLAKGFLASILPHADWTAGITNLGYTVGFLIVILGRMQLFTENTITPILPLFLAPTRSKAAQIARLRGLFLPPTSSVVSQRRWYWSMETSCPRCASKASCPFRGIMPKSTPFEHFASGIPAGFMIAALVWMMPRLQSAGEVLMIVIITYIIGLGGMSHVVAGSSELFILVVKGELGIALAVYGGILPAFAGNVLGGTGIFAALTYAQVRQEI